MSESTALIDAQQERWAAEMPRDTKRRGYLATIPDNLFAGTIDPATEIEFKQGDGTELLDGPKRPAKMRALASSSALAVNFFAAWRSVDKAPLSQALGLPAPIVSLQFEYKPDSYPVRPRSPNLDLLLQLDDGKLIGVESKFSEPYRSREGHGVLSARYFPAAGPLWSRERMMGAQLLADRLQPEWIHLDTPQLLKHMLGLASMRTPRRADALLYIWFDTGEPDAHRHQQEVDRFAGHVAADALRFLCTTYQRAFAALGNKEPASGWSTYIGARYALGTA